MTLVSRSAIRLSRRAGQQAKSARANVALLSTAARTAQQVPSMLRADARPARSFAKAKEGEWMLC